MRHSAPGGRLVDHRRVLKVEACTALAGCEVAPCAVIFHGNGELIDHIQDYAEWYHRQATPCSSPSTGEAWPLRASPASGHHHMSVHRGSRAAPEVDGKKLVYHGRSLGCRGRCPTAEQRSWPRLQLSLRPQHHPPRRYLLVPGFLVKHPFRTDGSPLGAGADPAPVQRREQRIRIGEKLHELTRLQALVEPLRSHNCPGFAAAVLVERDKLAGPIEKSEMHAELRGSRSSSTSSDLHERHSNPLNAVSIFPRNQKPHSLP